MPHVVWVIDWINYETDQAEAQGLLCWCPKGEDHNA